MGDRRDDGFVRKAVRPLCVAAAACAIIAVCPACAEDALCRGVPELSANPALALGHVTSGAGRVHFIKDARAQPGCPSLAQACAERAYLVPGDRVIISARADVFVCASYINAKNGDWSGWLPADAVADDNTEPAALADWIGKWSREEAGITVKAGKAGALRIEGEATFGAQDPARVKRGAVNSGEIDADVKPSGNRLSFAIDGDTTVPVDKGDEFACKVWMQRVGPWLIVDDNTQCGGVHVTFRGLYMRKP
jgi:hypothetical protein